MEDVPTMMTQGPHMEDVPTMMTQLTPQKKSDDNEESDASKQFTVRVRRKFYLIRARIKIYIYRYVRQNITIRTNSYSYRAKHQIDSHDSRVIAAP